MIKLIQFKSKLPVYVAVDFVGAVVGLEKTDKYPARTRIDFKHQSGGCVFVEESPKRVQQLVNLSPKDKKEGDK